MHSPTFIHYPLRKGIVHFNDACDKRHLDASRVHAQVKDSMANNQVLFTLISFGDKISDLKLIGRNKEPFCPAQTGI